MSARRARHPTRAWGHVVEDDARSRPSANADGPVASAIRTMDDFAHRTGLTSDRSPSRYLWTDAFAVTNWLGLFEVTGDERYLALARRMVGQVHRVLGRHRDDAARTGWISGLPEEEGGAHPTSGGLRIGKPLNERARLEPYDPRTEWDRDGQYYHYLTKWMLALARMWRVTGEATYHRWAVELALVAHGAFSHRSETGLRLRWKMSIDLSHPLVPSSGQHDPLDGLVTTRLLLATWPPLPDARPEAEDAARLRRRLERAGAELAGMCRDGEWVTDDPLGAGGLMVDALRSAQLVELGDDLGRGLLTALLTASRRSLQAMSRFPFLHIAAARRLAFRELGLAIGFEALERLDAMSPDPGDAAGTGLDTRNRELSAIRTFSGVGRSILDFWGRADNRTAPCWTEHRDISDVMWATCLVPSGLLDL